MYRTINKHWSMYDEKRINKKGYQQTRNSFLERK